VDQFGPVCSAINSKSILYEKTVVISGLSKNFGLAGLRIGYIICPNLELYIFLPQYLQYYKRSAFRILEKQKAGEKEGKWVEYNETGSKKYEIKDRILKILTVQLTRFTFYAVMANNINIVRKFGAY
jgi:aspartate/methionine/tyrosine aminotransferase